MTIYLQDVDNDALRQLAQQEFRTLKEQAALIISIELVEQGLLEPDEEPQS